MGTPQIENCLSVWALPSMGYRAAYTARVYITHDAQIFTITVSHLIFTGKEMNDDAHSTSRSLGWQTRSTKLSLYTNVCKFEESLIFSLQKNLYVSDIWSICRCLKWISWTYPFLIVWLSFAVLFPTKWALPFIPRKE